ncbi:MAG: DNA polymerase III subunit epsilon [Gammaproteobacteria bacterium]
MRQIVLDTETTGLETKDGHRIIEIGCIELVNRKFTGKRYHQFINPEREIEAEAIAVHGITNQYLQNKPKFAEIMQEFVNFIAGAELIIHNAPFDIGFINYELSLANKKARPITDLCRVLDTLVLAKQLHVGQRNSLDALCKRYSVDNSQREMHGALLDAHLLAQVYLAMTGGQGSLFEDSQTSETSIEEVNSDFAQIAQTRQLRVLKANEAELLSHQEHLNAMSKKGKCLWLEITS